MFILDSVNVNVEIHNKIIVFVKNRKRKKYYFVIT